MQRTDTVMVSARLPAWLADAIKVHAAETKRRQQEMLAAIIEEGLPGRVVAAAKRRAGR